MSREPSLLGVRRPPGAAMEVYIPSFRYEESDLERGYTVGAGPGARAEAAESGRCPSGRRRPRAGVPARSPSPPPAQRKGCALGRLSRKRAPPARRPGAAVPSRVPPCPAPGVGARSPGVSRVPGHGAALRPPPGLPSPAGLRPSASRLLPLPGHWWLRGGWMWASKSCGFHSEGDANF